MTDSNSSRDIEQTINWFQEKFQLELIDHGDVQYLEEEGLVFQPYNPIDFENLTEIVNRDEYTATITEDGVVMYRTDKIGETEFTHKVGVTFRRNLVPLGGVDSPIHNGVPIDETTRETIRILGLYLQKFSPR